jgi:hypothetical protein
MEIQSRVHSSKGDRSLKSGKMLKSPVGQLPEEEPYCPVDTTYDFQDPTFVIGGTGILKPQVILDIVYYTG